MMRIYRKKFWQGSESNPEPAASELCCPKPTAVICFSIKSVGIFGLKKKQDARLAPAKFLTNYKFFDQILLTVKNETSVLIIVFIEFLQTPIPPLISVLFAKGYHDFFHLKNFCLSAEKFPEEVL